MKLDPSLLKEETDTKFVFWRFCMKISKFGNAVRVPVFPSTAACICVNVMLPKLAKLDSWLFTVGLSTIHSAVNRVEL